MTIDHDAIAARARDHIARGGSPYIAPSEYLDLYDEVTRLRAEARQWCGHTYTVDGRAALVMAFETAARQWRETYCLASPGSDEEFHAILSGFDTAVGMFRAAMKGDSDE